MGPVTLRPTMGPECGPPGTLRPQTRKYSVPIGGTPAGEAQAHWLPTTTPDLPSEAGRISCTLAQELRVALKALLPLPVVVGGSQAGSSMELGPLQSPASVRH